MQLSIEWEPIELAILLFLFQLQSNYAGDFRSILRNVFQLNATQDEPDVVDGNAADDANEATELTAAVLAAGAAAVDQMPLPAEQVIAPVDLATDALHHELGRELYDQHLRQRGRRYEEFSNDDDHEEESESAAASPATSPSSATNSTICPERHGAVYGQNLGLHEQLAQEFSIPPSNEFYQPEPALLDIASGGQDEIPEIVPRSHPAHEDVEDDVIIGRPPPWVPDALAPHCFGCTYPFTVLRRRHHCRACGGVFCGRCSSHSIPLPQFGLSHPVRVCNRCHLLIEPVQSPISESISSPTPSSPWNRSFGMVS